MLVRSGLPISFSEGFNPHPRLNIALPLSIYQEGERELFDFRITEDVDEAVITEKLRKAAFPGMEIIKAELAIGKLHTKRAVWRLELESELTPDEVKSALSGEMVVTKRTKNGEKQVDIAPMARFVSAERVGERLMLRVELNAAGNDYLNPSYIAAFLGDKVKLMRTVRENIIF
jgi:radical SAM-linked protein